MFSKKFLLLISILGATTLSTSAFAQNNGFYVGGQLGYSDSKNEQNLPQASEQTPPISAVGSNIITPNDYATQSVDNNGLGGRLYAGYQFNKYLAVESGYTRFADTDIENGFGLKGYNYTLHNQSADVMAKGMLPINDKFHLYAKAGGAVLFQDDVSYDLYSNTVVINGTTTQSTTVIDNTPSVKNEGSIQPAGALGAEYALTDNLSADLSYMKVGFNDHTPSLASLGISYHF